MKKHCLLTYSSLGVLALTMLITPMTKAAANRKPVANAGFDQIVGFSTPVGLDGRRSVDPDGIIKKYQWSQIKGPKVTLARTLTPRPAFRSPARLDNQESVTLVFKLTVTDNQKAVANDVVAVTVARFTGKLNDTGITTCSNKQTNDLPCPVVGYPEQDAESGRDKTHNDNRDGHAGFSFTKISSIGKALPASAKTWNCVQDNVTGLMWEIKTNDGKLHDKDWTYSWYEPDNTKNGGKAGKQNGGSCGATSACDTAAYVKAVNTAGWCGAKEWRMPTMNELFGIASRDRPAPAIDTIYFPNTPPLMFWSSSPYRGYSNSTWIVFFDGGHSGIADNDGSLQVRLVRNGQ